MSSAFSNIQLIQPFHTSNDGSRSTMVSSHLNQRIPVMEPEIPHIISTAASYIGMQSSKRAIRVAKADGEVLLVSNNLFGSSCKVVREGNTVDIIKDYKSVNRESFVSLCDEKTNSKSTFRGGEVIHNYSEISEDFIPKMGVNAHIVYQSQGDNFEDSFKISESFAKKLSHIEEDEISIIVNSNEYLMDNFELNEGTEISRASRIIAVKKVINKNFMNSLLGSLEDINFENDEVFFSSEDGGFIDSIFVYSNADREYKHHANLKKLYEKCIREVTIFKDLCTELIGKGIVFSDKMNSMYRKSVDYLNPNSVFTIRDTKFNGYYLDIKIRRVHSAMRGTKLTTFYASKGLITKVVPDVEMPFCVETGRYMDIVVNPLSVIGRLNLGLTNESIVSNLLIKMRELINGSSDLDEIRNIYFDFVDNLLLNVTMANMVKASFNEDDGQSVISTMSSSEPMGFPIDPNSKPTRENFKYLSEKYDVWQQKSFTIGGQPVHNKLSNGTVYVIKLKHEPYKKISYTSANKLSTSSLQPVKDNRFKKNKSPSNYVPSTCGEMELMSLLLEEDKYILNELIYMKSSTSKITENFMESQLNGAIDPKQSDIIGDNELKHNGVGKLGEFLKVIGLTL